MKTEAIIPVFDAKSNSGGTDFIISSNLCDEVVMHLDEPHRHANYTIDLLVSGEIMHQLDFVKYPVQAPAILLISPEQVHVQDTETKHEVISISFSKDYIMHETEGMLACWECMFDSGSVDVTREQMDELVTYAKLMFKEYASKKPKKEAIIRSLLSAFIICCARTLRNDHENVRFDATQNNMVRTFRGLVDQHYAEKTQVMHYAEMLFVTPGHLNDTIKSITGKTAKQLIDAKRIMEAKRLLFWGKHSVKEIAWELNFEDDAYFNRFFKKHTGSTPAHFQRGILNKYN